MTGTLDALSGDALKATQLLQERRTALISAAVTGQIDVRQPSPMQSTPAAHLQPHD
jgi:type I restriction enzyme S subunit